MFYFFYSYFVYLHFFLFLCIYLFIYIFSIFFFKTILVFLIYHLRIWAWAWIWVQVFLSSNPRLNSDFCKDKNLITKQGWNSKFLLQTWFSPLKVCWNLLRSLGLLLLPTQKNNKNDIFENVHLYTCVALSPNSLVGETLKR